MMDDIARRIERRQRRSGGPDPGRRSRLGRRPAGTGSNPRHDPRHAAARRAPSQPGRTWRAPCVGPLSPPFCSKNGRVPPEEAIRLAAAGTIRFSPCHEHKAVGAMAGVIYPSMPVFIVSNPPYGNTAYCGWRGPRRPRMLRRRNPQKYALARRSRHARSPRRGPEARRPSN